MISLSHLFENQGKLSRAYDVSKDAAALGYDVSKDTGSHVMRNREKYGWAAVGAGATIGAQKAMKAIGKAFQKKQDAD
jgi:hypothetical protein